MILLFTLGWRGLEKGCDVSIIHLHWRSGACRRRARVALFHVELDKKLLPGVVRSVTIPCTNLVLLNAIPYDNIRKSHHFSSARSANTSPCFWTRAMVPAGWMEMPAAWDAVEPRVKHSSCDTLKEWAKRNCLIMFLDGKGCPLSRAAVAGVWLFLILPMCLR